MEISLRNSLNWLRALGYPILADSLSGLRFGEHVNENIIGGYDTFLPTNLHPQLILRFGDVPTSNALCDYLDSLEDVPQIHISETKRWRDDRFRVTHSMWCDPLLLCEELLRSLQPAQARPQIGYPHGRNSNAPFGMKSTPFAQMKILKAESCPMC